MPPASLDMLNAWLSQRGRTAVPYAEGYKPVIREHLAEVQKVFPSLGVTLSEFHANDGRVMNLLVAEGTVPIHYGGAKYNIPVAVWLLDQYPRQAPLVYVKPTSTMIIKAGHAYVDSNGYVSIPYVRSWNAGSNLVDLCWELSRWFSQEPPLFSAPPGYVPPASSQPTVRPPPQQPAPPPAAAAGGGYPPAVVSSGYGAPAPGGYPSGAVPHPSTTYGGGAQQAAASVSPPNPYGVPAQPPQPQGAGIWAGVYSQVAAGGASSAARPPPPQGQQQQQQSQQRPPADRNELDFYFRETAITALEMQLHAAVDNYGKHAAAETEALLETQRKLAEREAVLRGMVEAAKAERAATEGAVGSIGATVAALRGWLDAHEGKLKDVRGGVDPLAVLQAADDLSEQSLQAQASDLAAEDTILALDQALQAGALPLDVYLRQVRSLCAKQFMARALGLKVAAAQRSAPPRSARGPSHSGSVSYSVAHGDSWSSSGVLHNPLSNAQSFHHR